MACAQHGHRRREDRREGPIGRDRGPGGGQASQARLVATITGDPPVTAPSAALASMDLLEKPECRQQINMIMDVHTRFLGDLENSQLSARAKNLRQAGTIMAFEWEEEKNNYLNPLSARITEEALKRGVYLRPLGNTIYLMPPYCITQLELEKVNEVLLEILKTL